MRILHLISSSGLFGAERVVLVLSKALKKKNHEPIVGVIENRYNPHTEVANEAKAAGLDTVTFPCRWQFDPRTALLIREFTKNEQVDIVHSHGYKSNFYALVATSRLTPKIATNHNWLTDNWRLKIYCLLDSMWIRRFDHIVAVSDKIKDEMINKGVPPGRISVIDNGIDLERFEGQRNAETVKKDLGINEGDVVIGTIGNLNREKGHVYLLEAAKEVVQKYDSVKFLLIGDGELRQMLEKKVKNVGLDKHVIFTGIRNDIPELLSLLDIFVLASIREGLPMALLEAMASKTPVVASKVGGIPGLIEDRVSGILVEPKDIKGIAHGIMYLIKNPAKANILKKNALERIVNGYSSDTMCERYLSTYLQAIRLKGSDNERSSRNPCSWVS